MLHRPLPPSGTRALRVGALEPRIGLEVILETSRPVGGAAPGRLGEIPQGFARPNLATFDGEILTERCNYEYEMRYSYVQLLLLYYCPVSACSCSGVVQPCNTVVVVVHVVDMVVLAFMTDG